MKYFLLITCIVLNSVSLFAQTDTLHFSVINKGKKITGYQKIWQNSPSDIHYAYQFNDRGRGDSVQMSVRLNSNGLISSLDVTGIDYYKNPYSEHFNNAGDSVQWTVNGERKSKKSDNQFYATTSVPASISLLVKWAINQPGKRAAILPDGFVNVKDPLVKTITRNGKTLSLKLFSIYFEPAPIPYYVWLTDDLQFFAAVSSWTSQIKKGYEAWTDTLFTIQEIASQSYYESEVKNYSKSLKKKILFANASVFNSATATVQKNMFVVVEDGKIKSVSPASTESLYQADTIINCKGKFLMPGLWDMHGHYGKEEGAIYLAGGVTHIRDMGNDNILLTYKKQINENKLLGPDISYISGFIDKVDPYQGPTGKFITSVEEGNKAIDEYHALGYQQIKLYSAIKPEWVAPLATHAHSLGMRMCGHIPAFMTAEQAINSGYNEITHMNFIFLNFMGDTIDTRTPTRFRVVGDHAGELDLQSKKVKDFVSLMKKKNIVLDPTMNVWQGMFDEFKGDTSNYLKPVIGWLPPDYLSSLAIQSPFGSESNKSAYKSAYKNMLKMVKLLYDNGIMLVAGTDGGEANALHHELEIYVEAGIPANEVLKIATYNAALDCKMQDKYGEIKPGADADFILIDGNPAQNIHDIRRVEWVIKNKKLYQPKELLKSQGWSYYY